MPLYIESPITGGQIQVSENDFPDKMTWDQAKSACKELGKGWRLPSDKELRAMGEQLHKQGKGNFKDEAYWSGTHVPANWLDNYIVVTPKGGKRGARKHDLHQVRAVRTLP